MWAGLLRIGWSLFSPAATLPVLHGPLLVSGFVGTLVGLERAVGLGRGWAFAAPFLSGTGSIATLLPLPAWIGPVAVAAGSAVLLAVFAVLTRRQPGLAMAAMTASVALWLAGNVLWASGTSAGLLVPWWIGFVVVLIAGERLELARFLPLTRAHRVGLVASFGLLGGAIAASLWDFDLASHILGFGLAALAVWLLLSDVASWSVRAPGFRGYIANGLFVGYAWLGLGAAFLVAWGLPLAGPQYDAAVHAVFLGFVFSMIFAHGPIVFPAILGRPLAYSSDLYAPLALLHGSLALRVVADVIPWTDGRLWGGLLNGLAILLFFAIVAASVRRARASSAAPV